MTFPSRLIVILFLFIPLIARADAIDSYIKTEMQATHIPGLSITVVKDGKIVRSKGYGLANIELNVPVSADTVFQLGSIGKQFTAALIMKLVEQGKIHLDDKVSQYIPNTPATWKDITLRQLLTHTAGIKEYTSPTLGQPSPINERQDYTDAQLLKFMQSYPLDFAPGTKYNYSDTEYVLLGIVIKQVTGRFYGDLLQEYFFAPLGMNATRIISDADIVPHRAAGYVIVSQKTGLKNQDYVSPSLNTTADGSVYSTSNDMGKWIQAFITDKVLPKGDREIMWTAGKLNNGTSIPYGFGWAVRNYDNNEMLQHSGWWQGFTTFIVYYKKEKMAILVLTNIANNEDKIFMPCIIAEHVAGLYSSNLMPKDPVKNCVDP